MKKHVGTCNAWKYVIEGNAVTCTSNKGRTVTGVFIRNTIAWTDEVPKSLSKRILSIKLMEETTQKKGKQ